MQLESLDLTTSGRLILKEGEFEKALIDQVDLEIPDGGPGFNPDKHKGGDCILTTQRLVWRGGQGQGPQGPAVGVPLASIQRVKKETGYGFRMKVSLVLTVAVDQQGTPSESGALFKKVALRCRATSPDNFKEQLDTLLSSRSWQAPLPQGVFQAQPPPITPPPPSAAPPPAQYPTPAAYPPPQPWYHQQQQQPQYQSTTAPSQPAAIDYSLVKQLQAMGFPRNTCIRAVQATNSASLQAALDYTLAYGAQPGMNDPLPPTPSPPPPAPTPAPLTSQAPFNNAPPSYPYSSPSPYSHPYNPPGHPYPPQGPGGYPGGYAPSSYTAGGHPTAGGGNPYSYPAGQLPAASPWDGGRQVQPGYDPSMVQNPLLQQPQQPPLQQQAPRPVASLASVGVGGLLQKQAQQAAETSKSLEVAFKDLGALMAMAQQMTALAEKFRGVAGGAEAAGGDVMDAATQQELIALGIQSPVTKESAGAKYHQELARQLADFLFGPSRPGGAAPTGPLARAGGVLPLPDIYSLFNRARGTELVSPDDLLQCAALFPSLRIPLTLRRFASGVIVLQTAAHSDTQVAATISQIAQPASAAAAASDAVPVLRGTIPGLGPPLTASDVARAMGVPLTIAAEHLATAEQLGAVCRDDGPEGLRYFRNFFMDAAAPQGIAV